MKYAKALADVVLFSNEDIIQTSCDKKNSNHTNCSGNQGGVTGGNGCEVKNHWSTNDPTAQGLEIDWN